MIFSGCRPSVGVSACATPTDARRAAPRTAPVKFLVSLDFRNPKICFCCMFVLSSSTIHLCEGARTRFWVFNVPEHSYDNYITILSQTQANDQVERRKKKEPKKGSFCCHYFNSQSLRLEGDMHVVVMIGSDTTTVRH